MNTDSPTLDEQHSSRVYVYDFDEASGEFSTGRYFEEEGIAGSIGMNWAKNSNILHVSNFNLTTEKRDEGNSLVVLLDTGTDVSKVDSYSTAGDGVIDEACWTLLSPDGNSLYVSSFGTNIISTFSLNLDGTVKESLGSTSSGASRPAGDSKDMYITQDGKYLYNIGAFKTFSISAFNITDSGIEYNSEYTYKETQGSIGDSGAYNFLGLDGFSK